MTADQGEIYADTHLRAEDVHMLIRCLTRKLDSVTGRRFDVLLSAAGRRAFPPMVYERESDEDAGGTE